MLASITPLGERGRDQRFGVTATAYLVASAATGTAFGALLGGLGGLLMPAGLALPMLAAGCLAGLALDLGIGGWRTPTLRRQVDRRWLTTYRGWVYGAGFGAQLGVGVVTVVTSSTTYVAFLAALVGRHLVGGALVGLAFGLCRGLVILRAAPVRGPAELARMHRSLRRIEPIAAHVALAAQAGAGLAAVAGLALK
jgi:hypothetical protein